MKLPFAHHLFGVSKRDCQLSSVRWRLESLSPPLCPAEVQPSVQCKGLQVTDKLKNPKKLIRMRKNQLQCHKSTLGYIQYLQKFLSQISEDSNNSIKRFIFWAHLPILQYTTTRSTPKKLARRRSKALCLSWRQKRSPLLLSLLVVDDRLMNWFMNCSNDWCDDCDASLFTFLIVCSPREILFVVVCGTLAKLIQVLYSMASQKESKKTLFLSPKGAILPCTPANTKCLSSVLHLANHPPPWDVPRAQYLMNSNKSSRKTSKNEQILAT